MAGNKYILTCQDDLSKFLVAIPIPQQDAETVAREFVLNIILKFGAPAQILTDQGSNFLSDLFKSTCKLLRIKKIQTAAFHRESNGSLERSYRVLTEQFRHYVREDQTIGMSGSCMQFMYTIPPCTRPPHTLLLN